MSRHNAEGQMLGYLYQARCALYLLLSRKSLQNTQYSISIEKFDDVSFEEKGTPVELLQIKHHINSNHDLSDSSRDLWRTLKVWLDAVSEEPALYQNIDFVLITTSSITEGSAVSFLSCDDSKRDCNKAYQLLRRVALENRNKLNSPAYKLFFLLDEDRAIQFLEHIKIIANTDNILDIENRIKDELRYSSLPQHIDAIFHDLEGWWFDKVVRILCGKENTSISYLEVNSFIVNKASQYRYDDLPITRDIRELKDITLSMIPDDQKLFISQLEVVNCNEKLMDLAVRDYFRAHSLRSSWLRNNEIFPNELEKYDSTLVDFWEYDFACMPDAQNATEDNKRLWGLELFKKTMMRNECIRKRCQEPFIMKGTYHILANRLMVGWHPDNMELFERKQGEDSND